MKSLKSSKKPKQLKLVIIRRVAGDSMLPTLKAGQLVIACYSRNPKEGQLVIFKHRGYEKIKRLQRLDSEGMFVIGDNQESSDDSRDFGVILKDALIAKVIWPRTSRGK